MLTASQDSIIGVTGARSELNPLLTQGTIKIQLGTPQPDLDNTEHDEPLMLNKGSRQLQKDDDMEPKWKHSGASR